MVMNKSVLNVKNPPKDRAMTEKIILYSKCKNCEDGFWEDHAAGCEDTDQFYYGTQECDCPGQSIKCPDCENGKTVMEFEYLWLISPRPKNGNDQYLTCDNYRLEFYYAEAVFIITDMNTGEEVTESLNPIKLETPTGVFTWKN